MMMSSSNRTQQHHYTRPSPPPFTPTQYQELEHQALIYKHLVSGVPIPHHLLSALRSAAWAACFHIGNKQPDPEPGRCRRTDGKKWRCAKEAYPDSKYCEKHMHRGKNRSKNSSNKPLSLQVLVSDSPTPTSTLTSAANSSSSNSSTPSSSITQSYAGFPTLSDYASAYSGYQQQGGCGYFEGGNAIYPGPFVSQHGSVDSQGLVLGSSSGNMSNKHSRYWSELKEETGGERSFFPEASRAIKGGEAYNNPYNPPSAIPLSKNSPNDHHYSQLQQQYQYYNVIQGSDQREVDSSSAPNSREADDTNAKNPFHQFFGEWPVKSNADSWIEDNDQGAGEEDDDDRDSCSQQHSGPTSTTQLSM